MNRFQGPGRDFPPISRESDAYLRQDPADVRAIRAAQSISSIPLPPGDWHYDLTLEDPDVSPIGVTDDDEAAAVRELDAWGYNPFELED